MRALCLLALGLLIGNIAQAAPFRSLSGPATCQEVRVSANVLDCQNAFCFLRENAKLTCDHLQLRADQIRIKLGDDSSFDGAVAEGNVVLIDQERVIQCNRIELDSGQIKGRIQKARLEVFESTQAADASIKPGSKSRVAGQIQQTITGDIERLAPDQFRLDDASFT